MQEPVALSFPVDPRERRLPGAGDEVVAPRLGAVPPARFDAFGPREQRERPFREAARLIEQPQRARVAVDPPFFLLSFFFYFQSNFLEGALRAMVLVRVQAMHRRRAEPRLQP